ncbi:GlxA family transcriptional regulator [Micromonospora krabiensis]|uniref:Transcriptional regulator GlxA family, contains an amidase domain and an AraC-type DNA-binding HTH domain n=1 Tax=Micromonospora krabiensis TaxID=307121 RepID=A0A1C3N303_9ACTN|nr:DJ-1/PfpI family protein [Micromonospora krabiensis]SBV26960.1 Transcriptional regulator GlxA family, contains an amidase domain and an AraC-type DNA-binding HTH domain [Micromonospora krabiensis]
MRERLVLIVAYDGAELLDIACVSSSLDIANRGGARPPYRTVLATPSGHAVTCDSGLRLEAQVALERFTTPPDTLVVSGGLGHLAAAATPTLVGHVRRLAGLARRVSSVCTGATVLAEAGLLAHRRATSHWMYAEQLARAYPEVRVDPDPIFVRDGNVATSGGVTSALDLTLSFIEEDHGTALARGVALGMVAYLQRPGSQAQMSMFLSRTPGDDLVVLRTRDHIVSHLAGDLGAATLARLAGVSERHLSRLFLTHLRETPAQYVRRTRTEAAAHLLVSTTLPLAAVARRCGFGSTESLRQAFLAYHAVPPSRFRAERRAGGAPLGPEASR